MIDHSPSIAEQGAVAPRTFASQLTLGNLLAIAWRQKYVLTGVLALVLLAGLVYTLLVPPTYEAVATLQVESRQEGIVEGEGLTEAATSGNDYSRYMETLGAVIRSRKLAEDVVEILDLTNDPAFMAQAGVPVTGDRNGRPDAVKVAIATSILQGGVAVDVPLANRIMAIRFTSRDPRVAARVANGYVEAFLAHDINRSAAANQYALTYLEGQITDLQQKLQDSETRANAFARSNRIVGQAMGQPAGSDAGGASTGTAPTLTAADLININQTYSEARAARIEAQQRWLTVAGKPASQLPEVQQDGSIQTMRAELAQLNARLSDLRQRYRDDYPEVRELIARIEQTERNISRSSEEVKSSIRNAYEVAQGQEAALARELQRVSDRTLDEQDRRVAFGGIDREVAAYREQLDALLTRYNEISAAANVQINDATVLDSAQVPGSPSAPNMTTNLLVSLIVGVGLALALALVREFLDDRLRNTEDIERKIGLYALGQVPHVSGNVAEEIEDPFSPLSEAYSSLRATLDYGLSAISHPVIQITSSEATEGKTTSATALARKFANVGKRTLLVDMDLRRPAVGKALDVKAGEVGVVDVLLERVSLAQAVKPGPVENLELLLVTTPATNPVEIISSGLVPQFIERQRKTYDIIIIDSSPVMGIADAPLLARYVDATVMIVEANSARVGKVRAAVRRLQDSNAKILGAVLTKYRALEAGDSYNYQASYYTYVSEKD